MKVNPEVIRQWINDVINDGWNLTKWEENFIASIDEQFARSGSLSERQTEILERIYTEKVK